MNIRRALTGVAAGALLLVGAGAGSGNVFFLPEEPMDFSDSPISLVYLEIDQITC